MTRITCACQTCKTNATKIGASFPMQADVPAKMAKAVDNPHALVFDAHNPGAIGDAMRRATGIRPT